MARQNNHHFPDDIFKCISLNEKAYISIKNWSCFQWSNLQQSSIGADNGLALARWQAIIWTNGGYPTDAFVRRSASVSKYINFPK